MTSTTEQIEDLDDLVPPDKKVKLGDRIYRIPGDMPLEVYLKVNAAAAAEEGDAGEDELLNRMIDALVDLFCWHVSAAEAEAKRAELERTLRGLGIRTLTSLLGRIYKDDEPETDAEDPPSPTAEDGTPTSTTS